MLTRWRYCGCFLFSLAVTILELIGSHSPPPSLHTLAASGLGNTFTSSELFTLLRGLMTRVQDQVVFYFIRITAKPLRLWYCCCKGVITLHPWTLTSSPLHPSLQSCLALPVSTLPSSSTIDLIFQHTRFSLPCFRRHLLDFPIFLRFTTLLLKPKCTYTLPHRKSNF